MVHPDRSFPLNSAMGLPHFGVPLSFNDGAFSPVHVHVVVPSGAVAVPESVLPVRVPLKTISLLAPSSSFGETNFNWPFVISTFGSGRAFPQRPTITAFSWPFSCVNSSHDGYSLSGALSVKSQRPRNDSTGTAGAVLAVLLVSAVGEHAATPNANTATANREAPLCNFIRLVPSFSARFQDSADLPR